MLSAECHKRTFHAGSGRNEATRVGAEFDDQKRFGIHTLSCPNMRLLARLINQMLASGARVSAENLLKSERGEANISRARQVAVYLMHTSLSLTYGDVSRIYGRDRTTIAHSCRVVEDLRDDPEFDAWIAELEAAVDMMLNLSLPISSRKDAGNG